MMRLSILTILALLLIPQISWAQAWSGVLNSSRAIDWQANPPGVIGGIPTTRTQCGSTVAAGTSNSSINGLIAACTAGTYLKLGVGTFNLTGPINILKSNVTLRGSGPDKTILKFTGIGGCVFGGQVNVCGNPTTQWFGTPNTRAWETPWTGGFTQGTTQITVGTTANTAAGRYIFLDQQEDLTDTGGIVNSHLFNVFGGDSSAPNVGRSDTDDAGVWRVQSHMHKVLSVDSATTLTITPPIQMPNWRSGANPEMFGIGTSANDVIEGVGIEDMTLENVDQVSAGQKAIVEFASTCNSWAKNIRTINGMRAHLISHQACHIEIRDSYMYKNTESGSQAYGIETQGGYDNLYLNNIGHYTTQMFLGPCPGCVTFGNYSFGQYFTLGCNDVNVGGSGYSSCNWGGFWTHAAGGGMELIEANDFSSGIRLDINHGTSPLLTYLRNRFGGYDDDAVTTQYRMAADVQAFNRAHNFVGNVLGVAGIHTTYSGVVTSGGDPDLDQRIYTMGGDTFGIATDSLVSTSLLRWGNYDTVTGAVRWCGNSGNTGWVATCGSVSEIPTSGITYVNGNTVPATETVPTSFFFNSRPSWWGTPFGNPAWPAIGPEVTGGNVANYGGRVYKIPARLCFENMANDPAYPSSLPRVKLFNATSCYTSAITNSVISIMNNGIRATGGVRIQ